MNNLNANKLNDSSVTYFTILLLLLALKSKAKNALNT